MREFYREVETESGRKMLMRVFTEEKLKERKNMDSRKRIKDANLNIRIASGKKKEVEIKAEEMGLSPSALLTFIISDWLKNYDKGVDVNE